MDNNIDMANLIKKAQEMINNNEVPHELKSMLNQISTNSVIEKDNNNSSTLPQDDLNSSSEITQSIDISNLTKLLDSLNNSSNDDSASKLLIALKPYLRDNKKEKIDDYIKLLKLGKITQLLNIIGGDKTWIQLLIL